MEQAIHVTCFNKLIEKDEECVRVLTELPEKFIKSSKRCEEMKWSGTTLGVLGAGCVLYAQLTGDVWLQTCRYCVYLGIGGLVCVFLTALFQLMHNRISRHRLKRLAVDHDHNVDSVKRFVQYVQCIVNYLRKRGLSRIEASCLTLSYLREFPLNLACNNLVPTTDSLEQQIPSVITSLDVKNLKKSAEISVNQTADIHLSKFVNLMQGSSLATNEVEHSVTHETLRHRGINRFKKHPEITLFELCKLIDVWKKFPSKVEINTLVQKIQKEKESLENVRLVIDGLWY